MSDLSVRIATRRSSDPSRRRLGTRRRVLRGGFAEPSGERVAVEMRNRVRRRVVARRSIEPFWSIDAFFAFPFFKSLLYRPCRSARGVAPSNGSAPPRSAAAAALERLLDRRRPRRLRDAEGRVSQRQQGLQVPHARALQRRRRGRAGHHPARVRLERARHRQLGGDGGGAAHLVPLVQHDARPVHAEQRRVQPRELRAQAVRGHQHEVPPGRQRGGRRSPRTKATRRAPTSRRAVSAKERGGWSRDFRALRVRSRRRRPGGGGGDRRHPKQPPGGFRRAVSMNTGWSRSASVPPPPRTRSARPGRRRSRSGSAPASAR